jgi:hypothetical protein
MFVTILHFSAIRVGRAKPKSVFPRSALKLADNPPPHQHAASTNPTPSHVMHPHSVVFSPAGPYMALPVHSFAAPTAVIMPNVVVPSVASPTQPVPAQPVSHSSPQAVETHNTLFVGGLESRFNEHNLRPLFEQFGALNQLMVPTGKNIAFVDYVDRAAAQKALERLQNFNTGTLPVVLQLHNKFRFFIIQNGLGVRSHFPVFFLYMRFTRHTPPLNVQLVHNLQARPSCASTGARRRFKRTVSSNRMLNQVLHLHPLTLSLPASPLLPRLSRPQASTATRSPT